MPTPNYGGPGLAPMVIGYTVCLQGADECQPSSAGSLPRSNAVKLAEQWQDAHGHEAAVWIENAKGRVVWGAKPESVTP